MTRAESSGALGVLDVVDVLIVGAGPAGSAAAAVLASNGRRVLVLEKDRFPRPKVCGAYLSSSAREGLERLGLSRRIEEIAESIRGGTLSVPHGAAVRFSLPHAGWGISRARFDALVAERAGELGANVRFGTRVVGLDGDADSGFRARFAGPDGAGEATARAAIGAWGRWDGLDRELRRGFLHGGARFLGWSRDYSPDASLEGQVRLYAFPGGYCGLSRVEAGAVNLAGVIEERFRRGLSPSWESVLAHARSSNADLDRALETLDEGPVGFLGTGPVYFTAKPPVEDGVLMVGDAAGVIDPFSGEGQAAALASGILAAETLERGLAGEVALCEVPGLYETAWRRRFGRRFHWSAAFRRLMLHPRVGAVAARLAGERVARFAIRRLTT